MRAPAAQRLPPCGRCGRAAPASHGAVCMLLAAATAWSACVAPCLGTRVSERAGVRREDGEGAAARAVDAGAAPAAARCPPRAGAPRDGGERGSWGGRGRDAYFAWLESVVVAACESWERIVELWGQACADLWRWLGRLSEWPQPEQLWAVPAASAIDTDTEDSESYEGWDGEGSLSGESAGSRRSALSVGTLMTQPEFPPPWPSSVPRAVVVPEAWQRNGSAPTAPEAPHGDGRGSGDAAENIGSLQCVSSEQGAGHVRLLSEGGDALFTWRPLNCTGFYIGRESMHLAALSVLRSLLGAPVIAALADPGSCRYEVAGRSIEFGCGDEEDGMSVSIRSWRGEVAVWQFPAAQGATDCSCAGIRSVSLETGLRLLAWIVHHSPFLAAFRDFVDGLVEARHADLEEDQRRSHTAALEGRYQQHLSQAADPLSATPDQELRGGEEQPLEEPASSGPAAQDAEPAPSAPLRRGARVAWLFRRAASSAERQSGEEPGLFFIERKAEEFKAALAAADRLSEVFAAAAEAALGVIHPARQASIDMEDALRSMMPSAAAAALLETPTPRSARERRGTAPPSA